jgi:hypothetical protein
VGSGLQGVRRGAVGSPVVAPSTSSPPRPSGLVDPESHSCCRLRPAAIAASSCCGREGRRATCAFALAIDEMVVDRPAPTAEGAYPNPPAIRRTAAAVVRTALPCLLISNIPYPLHRRRPSVARPWVESIRLCAYLRDAMTSAGARGLEAVLGILGDARSNEPTETFTQPLVGSVGGPRRLRLRQILRVRHRPADRHRVHPEFRRGGFPSRNVAEAEGVGVGHVAVPSLLPSQPRGAERHLPLVRPCPSETHRPRGHRRRARRYRWASWR